MVRGNLLSFLAVILLVQLAGAANHWGYPDRNSTNEFPQWGGICDTGSLQSPIDLSVAGALKGYFPDFKFHNYEETITSHSLLNNGHTIKLSNFNTEMILSGGPLDHKYVVEEIHLHWWSEHTIDKIRYPMEAHIVHRNLRYANVTEAAGHKDGLSVIGVLFHASNAPNAGVGKILENIAFVNAADEIDKPVKIDQKFKLRELFPKLTGGYLTYPGSLTTPSCAESVTWIVLLDTFSVTMDQVNQFRAIETFGGKQLTDNYRDVQKKYNRPVMVVRHESSSAPASLGASAFSLLGTFVVVYISKFLQ